MNMSPVQGSVWVTVAGYVCRNSEIRRVSIPIFAGLRELVARYVFLNKLKCYFHAKKARSLIDTDLCLSCLN